MAGRAGQQGRTLWRRWALPLGSALLVVLATGLGVLWWKAPAFYENVDPEARATAAATTRAGILAVFAATVAALGAIVALAETRRANLAAHERDREADQRERYAKAIDQLGAGDDKVDVRLGGIYSLQRIAQDSDRDLPTVVEVLCAFVRGHGQGPDDSDDELEMHRPPPDVQAALQVIGRVHNHRDSHVDLQRATWNARTWKQPPWPARTCAARTWPTPRSPTRTWAMRTSARPMWPTRICLART